MLTNTIYAAKALLHKSFGRSERFLNNERRIAVSEISKHSKLIIPTRITSDSSESTMMTIDETSVAIIHDGPQRLVAPAAHGPDVTASYPKLERASGTGNAPSQEQNRTRHATEGHCPTVPIQTDATTAITGFQSAMQKPEVLSYSSTGSDTTCSGRQSVSWHITDETLYAYAAMRGNQSAPDKGLYSWAKRRNGSDQSGDCGSLVDYLDGKSEDVADETPDTGAFVIPRPEYRHLRTSETSRSLRDDDPEKCKYTCGVDTGAPQTATKTPQNDERMDQDPGRISPCTFRLWSTGCGNMLPQQHQYPMYTTVYYPVVYAHAPPAYTNFASRDYQDNAQKHLSIQDWQKNVSNAAQKPNCPGPESGVNPAHQPGELITLTDEEIRDALDAPGAPLSFHGVPKAEVEEELALRYEALRESEYDQNQAAMAKRIKEDKIALLELQLQQVTLRAEEIHAQVKAEEVTHDPRTSKRREIYSHLQSHLADVAAKYAHSQQEIKTMTAQTEELAKQQSMLEASVRAVARSVGVTGLTDVMEIEMEVLSRATGVDFTLPARNGSGDDEEFF